MLTGISGGGTMYAALETAKDKLAKAAGWKPLPAALKAKPTKPAEISGWRCDFPAWDRLSRSQFNGHRWQEMDPQRNRG